MSRLFWCVLLGGLIFASPLYAKERKLNPFQDYIFIIFHGINDSKFSFNGESPEFTEEDKRARNVRSYLIDDLDIPAPYVKLYSYTQNRGSNIQNAKELGMPGYMAWHDGFQLGGAGLDAVVGLSSMLNLLNMRDLQFIATVTHIASALHNTAPQIGYAPKYRRDEFFSYHPSMLQHYATGVQPGHSFLEQAVIDFKNDYLISDLNKGPKGRIYQEIEDIPDTIVPKKFIFLGHSMSNMSMRLYVYSNELAEKGKFFDKGFYKDDVEKIVFMAPPMEGTEMAIGSLGLPFIKKSQLESIEKDLNGAAISDAYTYITGLWDRLKDPWLPIKDPMWPYTIGGPPMANMLRLYRYPKAKQYVAGYLGLTDPPSALFYPGTWEMIPDEVRLELLRTGADVGIDVAMGLAAGLGAKLLGKVSVFDVEVSGDGAYVGAGVGTLAGVSTLRLHGTKMGEVVHELKAVTKAEGKQEPMYSIVYGTGVGSLSLSDTMQMAIGNMVNKNVTSSVGTGLGNWGLMLSPRFQGLNLSGKLMNYVFSGAGNLAFTADGDLPVPAWSARAEKTLSMKDARRYEYRFESKGIETFLREELLIEMVGAEAMAWLLLAPPLSCPLDTTLPLLRMGVLLRTIERFGSNVEEYSRYLEAHGNVVAQRQLLTPALEETPVIDLSDTEYLSRQNMKWSGIYGVTRNVDGVSKNKELRPFLIAGNQYGIGLPSLNVVAGNEGMEITLFNGEKIKTTIATLSEDEIMIRGVLKELLPHQVQLFEYSNNFAGWESLKPKLKSDGRFELGPLKLYEGQNIIAFRATNRAGYSSNQILKILKTGISLQPVLDEIFPVADSVTNNPKPVISVAYQNMKYSDSAANTITVDSFSLSQGYDATSNQELILELKQRKVITDRLNRLVTTYTPNANLSDGIHNVTLKAHDAYNTSSFARYSFTVDTTPPVIRIQPVKNVNPGLASAVLNFEVSDRLSGVLKTLELTVTSSNTTDVFHTSVVTPNLGAQTMSWTPVTSNTDGVYIATIRAQDDAGNWGTATQSIEVDRAPPMITAMAPLEPVYTQTTPNIEFRITTNETAQAVIVIRDSKGTSVGGSRMSVMGASSTSNAGWTASGNQFSYSMTAGERGLNDGKYGYEIQLTDIAGNQRSVTGSITVDATGPEIETFAVVPVILNATNQHQTQVRFKVNGIGTQRILNVVVKNQTGGIVATRTVTAASGVAGTVMLNGSTWLKGAYSVRFIAMDEAGNTVETGMDIVNDGMGPVIASPQDGDSVSEVTAIRGQVLDPDFSNRFGLKKFKIMVKPGKWTVNTPADLTGFVEDPSIAWVPKRLRSGAGSDTEGTMEVRVTDTVAYINPNAPNVTDGEWTVALAVEEDQLGITGVAGVIVDVVKASGTGTPAGATGLGDVQLLPLPKTPVTGPVTIGFRVVNGEANVAMDIVDQRTQETVFSRRFRDIRGPSYLNVGGTPKQTVPAVYISKNPTTSVWTLTAKSDGTSRQFKINIMLDGNGSFTEVSPVQGQDKLTQLGTGMSLELGTSTEKALTFKVSPTDTTVTMNVIASLEDGNNLFRSLSVFVGQSAYPGVAWVPIIKDESVSVIWDLTRFGGVGKINNGTYEIRVVAEGKNGVGWVEKTGTVTVKTPFEARWGVRADASMGTGNLTAVEISPVDGQDVASLFVVTNKPATLYAEVRSESNQLIKVLASDQLILPVTDDNANGVHWDGTQTKDGSPTVMPVGGYQIVGKVVPVDGSAVQSFKLPVSLVSGGRTMVTLGDWIDLGTLCPTVTIDGVQNRMVQGGTYVKWRVKPSGKYYAPLQFNYNLEISDAKQRVTSYPYVPFVTVAHRWFDTVNVVPEIWLHSGQMKHEHHGLVWGMWADIYSREDHMVWNAPVALTGTNPAKSEIWDHEFVDNLNEWQSGKPNSDVRDLTMDFVIRAPDGTEMDRISMPVGITNWNSGQPELPTEYVLSNKGIFKARAMMMADGNGSRTHIPTRLKWELKLEENFKYSRLNNRFYPWFGFVNATKAITKNLALLTSDEAKLGFPHTKFFELTPIKYQQELKKVFKYPTELETGGTLTSALMEQWINHDYSRLEQPEGDMRSDCYNYLENEHFELILVNTSSNNILKFDPSPNDKTVSPNYGTALTFTVSTTLEKKVIVAWPKLQAIDDVIAINANSAKAVADADSEAVAAKNFLLSRSDKAQISTLFLSPDLDSGGVLRSWSRYLAYIPPEELTGLGTQITATASISRATGTLAGSNMTWTVTKNVLENINSHYLPANVVRDSYELKVKATEPSGNEGGLTINFSNGTQVAGPGSSLVVSASLRSWGKYWDGTDDPNLVSNGGYLEGVIRNYVPPVFNTNGTSGFLALSTGYPSSRVDGPQALWRGGSTHNPDIEVTDHAVSVIDVRGVPHQDIVGEMVPGSDLGGVVLQLKPNVTGHQMRVPLFAAARSQLTPSVNYQLSVRQTTGWDPLEKASDTAFESSGALAFWNVSRSNGSTTLKFENLDKGTVAMETMITGTRVDPAQDTEVKSPYGRVILQIPAGTFSGTKIITVTPVNLADIHIKNLPDISGFQFMPIIEILPDTGTADFKNSVNLVYQYTGEEVAQISSGRYPGLAHGVNLDAVSIYHISKSGILEPAQTNPAVDRWIDRDNDGVRGPSEMSIGSRPPSITFQYTRPSKGGFRISLN